MSIRIALAHPVPVLHLPARHRIPRRDYARSVTEVGIEDLGGDLVPMPEGRRRWARLAGVLSDGADLWEPLLLRRYPSPQGLSPADLAALLAGDGVPPPALLGTLSRTPLTAAWTEGRPGRAVHRTTRGADIAHGHVLDRDDGRAGDAVLRWCAETLRVREGALWVRVRPVAVVRATPQGTNVDLHPRPPTGLDGAVTVPPDRVAEAVVADDPRCVMPAEAMADIALLPPGARRHDEDATHLAHDLPGIVRTALDALPARGRPVDPDRAAREAELDRLAHLGAMAALRPDERAGALEAVCRAIDADLDGRPRDDASRRLSGLSRRLRLLALPRLVPAAPAADLDALGGLAP